MSLDSALDEQELKKYLQDAGAYEENLSHEDMLNCYKVIKCSESTAKEEDDQRNVTEILEEREDEIKSITEIKSESFEQISAFSLDEDFEDDIIKALPENDPPRKNEKQSTTKTSKSKFSLLKSDNLNSDSIAATKHSSNLIVQNIPYDVFNAPPLKHKPLDIILHKRKYDLPPYCNPKYDKLSITQRAKIICNFHRIILRKFYKLHLESLNPAPWGKSLSASEKHSIEKSQLSENDFDFNLNNEDEDKEIYTSRSGRQTKRKVYFDADDDENDLKKNKKDDDIPFEIENKPPTKRQNLNKLSNQDIMKRSKLFAETPKNIRECEIAFDEMVQSGKKTQMSQQMESVNDDLKHNARDEDDVIPNSQDSDNGFEVKSKELTFIRRRVIPPTRGRRGIGRGKLTTNNSDTSKSLQELPLSSTISSPSSQSPSTSTNSNNQKQKSTKGKTKCPICSEEFLQDEIEAHASSCGLLMETESNFNVILPGSVKKINCEICDKEMIRNTDYEVHVRDCIKNADDLEKL